MRVIVLSTATSMLVNASLPTALSQFTQFPMIAVATMCQRDRGLVPCKFGLSFPSLSCWFFPSRSYTDKACKNPVEVVSILNGFCLLGYSPNTSYKYDYPKENYYFSSADCTGAVTSYDISASTNVCYSPSTPVGSISAYQTLYVEN